MALSIRDVSKMFDNSKKDTLSSINLEIQDGEFVCFVGPSGCGKSTLLNIVAGLDQPTSGEVLLDGQKVTGPGSDRVVMFQEAALFPWLNVIDNVKFGMEIAGLSKKEQEEKAHHYLKMVQLWDFRHYAIHEISGGMKQRTALARSLSLDSKVLLMDEPFSALDKQTTNTLRDELVNIWLETKKTILFVTHSVEEAVFLADRIVVLSDNPGEIKKIYEVNMERPRHIEEPGFVELRKDILNQVRKEVEKIAEEEYDKK